MDDSIGGRVSQLIPYGQQRHVAAAVGMTPDGLSRALRGQRGFGAAELMRIADHLGADLHYLIAGVPDPYRVRLAARHDYDHLTGRRSVPGQRSDQSVLDDIVLAYRQAPPPPVAWAQPADTDDVREKLGIDFVRPFIDRTEQQLGIDIIRVNELSTAYSFFIDDRAVIVIPASGNWFRQNWDLAHELGHLVLAHHADEAAHDHQERTANAFAAELVMPVAQIRAQEWSGIGAGELADRVWDLGVSTLALANRLASLGTACATAQEWKAETTQKLLRHHWAVDRQGDPITKRMDEAASRRFPVALQASHLDAIASGGIGKGTLAWMLGVPEESLEVEQPAPVAGMSSSEVLEALGI